MRFNGADTCRIDPHFHNIPALDAIHTAFRQETRRVSHAARDLKENWQRRRGVVGAIDIVQALYAYEIYTQH